MSTPTDLPVVQGVPLQVIVTVPNGQTLWPTTHQAWGSIRKHVGGPEYLNLTPYLTTAMQPDGSLTVTLHVSGAQTRLLPGDGVYDIFVAESGQAQDAAIRVLYGAVNVELAVSPAPPVVP